MPFEFKFPDIGEGTDSGELLEWHVAEGQEVREDDPLAEVETDKATVTIPCPTTGRVLELRAKVGDLVPVGEVLAVFEATTEAPEAPPTASAPRAETPATATAGRAAASPPLASPAVRKRARDLGIELEQVRGSGPDGRIEPADLEQAAAGAPSPPAPAAGERDQVVPLRGTRRAIARAMTEAWRTIPHIIDYREADATELLAWRERLRGQPGHEHLTVTPLLLRLTVEALKRHPYANASIDLEREQITLRSEYNVGIATAAPDGLLVPVVHGADRKTVSELAEEIAELTRAARARRLRPEQLNGGTFTLNNYGSLGVWLGTPIIKPGEVANLGVGRVLERPVARHGQVAVRPIVALSVSGDHRVLDGHTLGAFVSDVVALIEDPTPVADRS